MERGEGLREAVAALRELPLPPLPGAPDAALIEGAALITSLRGNGPSSGESDAAPQDHALLHALFRDYALVSSAYLLEPKSRGLPPRARLPPQLARPLWALAHALDLPPFLEYTSYALGNYAPREGAPADAWQWQDLRLIRMLRGGPAESTFILVHAEIEAHSGPLLSSYADVLEGLQALEETNAAPSAATAEEPPIAEALWGLHRVLGRILTSQLKMFNACDPREC